MSLSLPSYTITIDQSSTRITMRSTFDSPLLLWCSGLRRGDESWKVEVPRQDVILDTVYLRFSQIGIPLFKHVIKHVIKHFQISCFELSSPEVGPGIKQARERETSQTDERCILMRNSPMFEETDIEHMNKVCGCVRDARLSGALTRIRTMYLKVSN